MVTTGQDHADRRALVLDAQESGRFWQVMQEIEILDGLAGSTFAQIVLGTTDDKTVGARIVDPTNIDVIRAHDVFGVREIPFI